MKVIRPDIEKGTGFGVGDRKGGVAKVWGRFLFLLSSIWSKELFTVLFNVGVIKLPKKKKKNLVTEWQ